MRPLSRSFSLRFLFAKVAAVAVAIFVVLFAYERYQLNQARKSGWEIVETAKGLRVQFGDKQYWNLMRSRLHSFHDVTDLHVIYALEKEEWYFIVSQKNLQSLRLERSRVTSSSINRLGDLASLKQLSFLSCDLQQGAFQAVGNLDGLETLELDEGWLSAEQVQEIARLSSLRHLKLGRSDCFPYLRQLRNLESIEYSVGNEHFHTPMPPKYLKILLDFPRLKELSIRNNRTFRLEHFDVLGNCMHLELLDLRTSEISRQGLRHFQAIRPNVVFLYDEDLVNWEELDEPDIVPVQRDTLLEQPLPEALECAQ